MSYLDAAVLLVTTVLPGLALLAVVAWASRALYALALLPTYSTRRGAVGGGAIVAPLLYGALVGQGIFSLWCAAVVGLSAPLFVALVLAGRHKRQPVAVPV
jgi:hypothetical protein